MNEYIPKLNYLQHINVYIALWLAKHSLGRGRNRLSINSRIGKVIPKGDNKWEKGKLVCIGASEGMSELMRMVRAITSMS